MINIHRFRYTCRLAKNIINLIMELLIYNEEIISKNIKYKKMLIDIHVVKYLLHLDFFKFSRDT